MREDRIGQLLVEADAGRAFASAEAPSDLADRVRRTHRRRTVVARSAVVSMVVGAIAIVASVRTPKPRVNVVSVESIRREVEDLDVRAAQHARVATILASRQSKPASSAPAIDPQLWLRRQRFEAASAIVRGADRLYLTTRDPSAAAAEYRRAIRLFPDTSAAVTATQRLERIPS